MKRLPYTLKILMPGLLAAHVIAAIQVYASNRGLYQTLTAMAGAGYLVVPNERVMPHLLEPGTAMAGALFFTLSLGAGLTVLSFAAAGDSPLSYPSTFFSSPRLSSLQRRKCFRRGPEKGLSSLRWRR
jgi:hypothetical protein